VAFSKPSFAQAQCGRQVQSEPFLVPSIRGKTLSIKISKAAYYRGLEACKINLCGCNALLNYLIVLLGDIVYSYILYAF